MGGSAKVSSMLTPLQCNVYILFVADTLGGLGYVSSMLTPLLCNVYKLLVAVGKVGSG